MRRSWVPSVSPGPRWKRKRESRMTRRTLRASAVMLVLAGVLVASACGSGTASNKGRQAEPFPEGETLGKIERLPGGTAVVSSALTLVTVACTNGHLTVTTNLQSIVGTMDCAQQIPHETLGRFYGQSVSISYANARLRIDSVSAGTIDLPVNGATITDLNATP
jgi:hypothetical protein